MIVGWECREKKNTKKEKKWMRLRLSVQCWVSKSCAASTVSLTSVNQRRQKSHLTGAPVATDSSVHLSPVWGATIWTRFYVMSSPAWPWHAFDCRRGWPTGRLPVFRPFMDCIQVRNNSRATAPLISPSTHNVQWQTLSTTLIHTLFISLLEQQCGV